MIISIIRILFQGNISIDLRRDPIQFRELQSSKLKDKRASGRQGIQRPKPRRPKQWRWCTTFLRSEIINISYVETGL